MGATDDLARFAVETAPEDIPPEVLHEAKRAFVNVVGLALYSSQDPAVGILLDLFRQEGGKPRATIIGTGVRTNLLNAALANGYTAQLEEFDDTHHPTVLHGSAAVFPAILGLAEEGVSGRSFLTAFVLGFEAAARVALAVHPSHFDLGWQQSGTTGIFGGAVAAGKLLGLSREQMRYALGLAGAQASGYREAMGTMAKALYTGWSAQSGLQGALLASRGFTSTQTILEGQRGFFHVFSRETNTARISDGLGKSWELKNNAIKAYACGVVCQAAVEQMVAWRREDGLKPEDVISIQAGVPPAGFELCNRPNPARPLESIVSLHHSLAVALADGEAYPAQFTEERLRDPQVAALRGKVTVNADPSLKLEQAALIVQLQDGRTLTGKVDHAIGSPGKPMSDTQVEEKFRRLATRTLPPRRIERLVPLLWNLDNLDDVSHLVHLLRTPRKGL